MGEYWEPIHDRGISTCAVWGTHDTYKVGKLTFATHDGDVISLPTLAATRDAAEVDYNLAVDERDQNLDKIARLNVRAIGVLRGAVEENDPLSLELDTVQSMINQGMPKILARGRMLVPLWQKINAKLEEATPPEEAVKVGADEVDTLDGAVTEHETFLRTVASKLSTWSTARSALRIKAAKVDRNNKRWYESWASNFIEGTPEHDALADVDTGPADTALPGEVTFTVIYDSVTHKIHIDASAPHATHFRELRKGPGEESYIERAANAESPMQDPVTLPGVYEIQLQARNSTGDGPLSVVKQVTVTG